MDEYIDRDLVHRMTVGLQRYTWASPVGNEHRETVDADDVNFGIDKIPIADVSKVVHGNWIIWEPPDELSENMQRSYVCSECKRNVAFILHGVEPLPPYMFGRMIYNYCPHCGAKMDKEGQ